MNRRDFLKDATALAMTTALALGAEELHAQAKPNKDDRPEGPPVACAVIGINQQGREILTSLAKLGGKIAPITALCDTFATPVFVKKAQEIAPSAKITTDYRQVLEQKDVQAVFIATPSHKHKQIVLDALAAGKHVYCEAPLATDLADAKTIAKAGAAAKTVFQPGLQVRCNAQHNHVLKFVRANQTLGTLTFGRAQWHSRESWKRLSASDERMNELNWRLSKETSSGLIGEIGIHQIDTATWFLKAPPLSVTGFGGLLGWRDGRNVPDTVQCVLQYPGGFNFLYDATLTNSYEGAYEMFYGTASAVQLRDQRAWMFKESDANDLGWETYARKDDMIIGEPKNGTGLKTGVGIALVADATKQLALGKDPGKVGTDVSHTALYQAIDAFLISIITSGKPKVSALEGYQATVIANKCNEAAIIGSKITFQPEWFTL